LPSTELAFDIGTGTGVVSALLAKRGIRKIVATTSTRALRCASDNLERLGLTTQVELQQTDLFPPVKRR
jgi:methylase of polypeptide subunit release factors